MQLSSSSAFHTYTNSYAIFDLNTTETCYSRAILINEITDNNTSSQERLPEATVEIRCLMRVFDFGFISLSEKFSVARTKCKTRRVREQYRIKPDLTDETRNRYTHSESDSEIGINLSGFFSIRCESNTQREMMPSSLPNQRLLYQARSTCMITSNVQR